MNNTSPIQPKRKNASWLRSFKNLPSLPPNFPPKAIFNQSKVETRVQITYSSRSLKIASVLIFCDIFSCALSTSNNMISSAICCNKHPRLCAVLLSLKNLLVFIYTRLHSKLCYLYLSKSTNFICVKFFFALYHYRYHHSCPYCNCKRIRRPYSFRYNYRYRRGCCRFLRHCHHYQCNTIDFVIVFLVLIFILSTG